MDYLEHEKEFFANYVPEEYDNIDEYIRHKRKNAVWGDNIELQVLGEMYGVRIEIYAYDNVPNFVAGVGIEDDRVLRLSYHSNSHYNSIVHKDINKRKENLISDSLGEFEDKAIASS